MNHLLKTLLILAVVTVLGAGSAEPRAYHYGSSRHSAGTSHHSSSGARPYYGGGRHTSSHGGHFSGGNGSSHKGGHYVAPSGGHQYGRHK